MHTELMVRTPNTERIIRKRGYVLVVDDEQANRLLLRDPLEAHNFEIAEAERGKQALALLAEREPDAVLLDIMMPDMDGFEVCRHIKKNPRTAHIPVLMVTALSERKERLMSIAAGANDFLTKPVDIQDVTLRVGNAVAAKRVFDQLQAERGKLERLLRNILPAPIAERMKQGETNIADYHPDVTVLIADLVGFTTLSAHIAPEQVVSLLNEIFSAFDGLVEDAGLEKIKTIGDAYMVAGGLLQPRADHVEACAQLALEMNAEIRHFNRQYNTSIHVRIGISTGPVIAGVIGCERFVFDVWGDTVNLACRLESAGPPDSIQVSETAYQRLKHLFQFDGTDQVHFKGRASESIYSLGLRSHPLTPLCV